MPGFWASLGMSIGSMVQGLSKDIPYRAASLLNCFYPVLWGNSPCPTKEHSISAPFSLPPGCGVYTNMLIHPAKDLLEMFPGVTETEDLKDPLTSTNKSLQFSDSQTSA